MKTFITLKQTLVTALASLSVWGTFGQTTPDTLFFHDGRVLPAHVKEMGLDEIKYHLPGHELLISVERHDLALVKMADGSQVRMPRSELNAQLSAAAMNKTQLVKFHFLSPACDHITFGYERMIRPWTNWEVTAGYIGAGLKTDAPPVSGFLFRTGVKFITRPDLVVRGMRLSHPLHGRYVKPEIFCSSFSGVHGEVQISSGRSTEVFRSHTDAGLQVVLGKQRFIGQGGTLDTWVGVGFAARMGKTTGHSTFSVYRYGHTYLGRENPLILSAGMSLGVAFRKGPASAARHK